MGINFEFSTSTRVIFGNGTFEKVPGLVQEIGGKILIVTGKSSVLADKLSELLKAICFSSKIINIHNEPTITDIENGVETARRFECNSVIGLGGGSAIDAGKAIAALFSNKGDLADYLEIIGKGKKFSVAPLPYIAIPTTAGTGAEATKNAVLKSEQHNVKISLRSDLMFPRIAVVDPQLTLSMPPEITASTGLDALTHLLETFVSIQSNPFIDVLCRKGLNLISESLLTSYSNGQNLSARENMAMASLLGGMALANVKLGAVHGFAGPLGGKFPVRHGVVCASLLPAVMEINIGELLKQNKHEKLDRYKEVARILTGNNKADIFDGVDFTKKLVKQLGIPGLSELGISKTHFKELVEKASASSSMQGNPVKLSEEKLLEILQKSY